MNNIKCLVLAVTTAATMAVSAHADGRTGPNPFTDAALNTALAEMNGFLQKRYAHADMMASLQTPPAQDFKMLARAVSDVPVMRGTETGSFGTPIIGGASLDLHLARFNEDREHRGDPLFMRIARDSGGTAPRFDDVAGVPPATVPAHSFGPHVQDDLTLDATMTALFDHMQWQATRDAALLVHVPQSDDRSFDRYGEALKLF